MDDEFCLTLRRVSRLSGIKRDIYWNNEELNSSGKWRISSSLGSRSNFVVGDDNEVNDFFPILRKYAKPVDAKTRELNSLSRKWKMDGHCECLEHNFTRSDTSTVLIGRYYRQLRIRVKLFTSFRHEWIDGLHKGGLEFIEKIDRN